MKFSDYSEYLVEANLTLKQENQISNLVTKYKKEGKTSEEAKKLAYKEVTGEDKEEETVEQKQRALRIRKLVISGYSEEDAIAEVVNALASEDKPAKVVLTVEGWDVTVDQLRAPAAPLVVQ